MNTLHLKQYADLKIKATLIEEQLNELKPLILEEMQKEEVDKVPTSLGSFTITKRKYWKYSGAVVLLKKQLDGQKKVEEADGTATFTETPILMFKQEKSK